MAEITTEKKIALVGDPVPSGIQFTVAPGMVQMIVKNDCTLHTCKMQPQEAVQMGVALIQMAGQAFAAMQPKLNGSGSSMGIGIGKGIPT